MRERMMMMMMTVRSAMTKLTSSSNTNTNTNTKRMMMWCLSSRPSLVLQRRRFKLETTTQNWDDDIDDDECKKHNRAETIVNYALESGKDVVVADVGCGHGQMSLLLHSRGVKRVIGIDKSQNEVNYANECLRSFQEKSTSASESGESGDDDNDEHQKTKNKIEFRIGDGLESVMEENVDVVIFAGMGTKLIRKLLSRGRSSETKSVRTLVINPPAGELVEFREWLWQNKWCIEKESLIIENANAHVVMKCTKKTGEEKTLSVLDLWLGKLQEEKKSSNVKAYAINRREYAKERMGVLEGLQSEGRLRDERELERYRNAYVALASWLEEEKT